MLNLITMRYAKDQEAAHIFLILFFIFILYLNFLSRNWFSLKAMAWRVNDSFASLSIFPKAAPKEIKDIVVVAVDNDSLMQAGMQWPWRRALFAELVNKISTGRPRAIFLDFAFLGKSSAYESDDIALAEALQKAGNVILGGYIEKGECVAPLDIFVSSSAGVGWVNKIEGVDLKVRDAMVIFPMQKETRGFEYGNEVKILAQARGVPLDTIRYGLDKVVFAQDLDIPVDKYGFTHINYAINMRGLATIPAYQVLTPGLIEPTVFKDKIVMVGTTAKVTHDIHLTPVGEIPGIYINAYTLLMFISENFLRQLPYAHSLAVFLLFTFGIGFLSLRLGARHSWWVVAALMCMASVIYFTAEVRYNFRMDIFSLLFLSMTAYITVETYKYATLLIDAQKLKALAVRDAATGMYTQRYFQLYIESLLRHASKKATHIFCFIHLNEFSELAHSAQAAASGIFAIVDSILKEHLGKSVLLARYGEDALSLCLRNSSRKRIEKTLSLLIEDIQSRDFMVEGNILKLFPRVAAVDFPHEHIKNYSDLIVTSESLLTRIGKEANVPLAVFDSQVDKITRSSAATHAMTAMPKSELGYVSFDLEARNKELEAALEELRKQQKKIEQTYFETMHSLVKALEEKDPYTSGHSERVSLYAAALAQGLPLPREEVEAIHKAAYLHDIGKIGLPDKVLHKKEKLDDGELEYVKRHQSDGAKILEGLPFYKEIVPFILYHHERYDGKGYPHGLSGNMIPRGAQIISVADAYDAMTTGRGYNSPLTTDEAIAELRKSSGKQFNPLYVDKFIELLEQRKIHAYQKP